MKKIMTLGGSSSKNSINKQLAAYAGSLVQGAEVINVDLNDYPLPLFSVDLEKDQGYSNELIALNAILDNVDGFVISLAEHNGAYSAAFKNTFDWLSRIDGKVWRNKPMILLSTSPGARGGKSVMEIALGRFPFNGGNIIGSMTFPLFNENFKEGSVVNKEYNKKLIGLSKSLMDAI